MSTFGLDENGDFPTGSIPFLTGKEAVEQNIKSRLSLIKGESCFFPDAGLDILNPLFKNQANSDLFVAELRAEILSIPQVTRILSLETNFDNGTVTYSVSLMCAGNEILNTGGLIDGF